ncbi:hypothetical protein EZS27_031656 [termite gut metagenome]|uniref:Conjugative transposon TraM C-terminal domain-containing protein n=1 Tax=termite gut metagenome TaxID=433724 RepID=A0A5J4QAW4_9ZZZZ
MDENINVNKDKQKQQLKKYGFYVLLAVIFAGIMWMIFRSPASGKEKEKEETGFNTEIPDPKNRGIIGDKTKAYEMDGLGQKEQEKQKSLDDFASLIGGENKSGNVKLMIEDSEQGNPSRVKTGITSSISSSASAYRDINRTLDNFYREPEPIADEQEILALEWRIQELEKKLEEGEIKKNTADEQFALIEKSYRLAAKYMPGSQTGTPQERVDIELEAGTKQTAQIRGKGENTVSPIKQVHEQTVSALAQDIPNTEFTASFNRPRNLGFNTPDAGMGVSEKNTISAVVHHDQTLINGQSVRLRLTEPMMAGGTVIPSNTILTGIAALQGERLSIFISSIEQGGAIIPVEIRVFDSDGQQGIYIPGSLELDAAKEIAANMGNVAGTGFTMRQSAEEQIASDLTKGAIQSVSQYMNKKIR